MLQGLASSPVGEVRGPRTSVVITSYNYAEYLPFAIDSVLNQSDVDLELLIVDDGSTDGSLEIARACSDPRVRVLTHPHRGLGATRNAGMLAANGRYVAFLDADDVWVREKLAVQCGLMDRCPDVGLSYTRFGVIDSNGQIQSSGYSYLASRPSGAILRRLLTGNVIGTPSAICVRRDLIEKAGLRFDETLTYSEDWRFYLDLATRTRVRHIPITLAYHRRHSRNLSRDIPTAMAQSLRTGRSGIELARAHLGLTERRLQRVRRRMTAYVESLAAREYVKAGNLERARIHAVKSLRQYPWNVRGALLSLFASIGWMPRSIVRRLK
jgi:glycosyltransferase involved in cell wall biosynthesis